MSKKVNLSGSLSISDADCSSLSGTTNKPLGLGGASCNGDKYYQSAVCTCKTIAAPSSFVDIDALEELSIIEFLYIQSSVAVTLRLYAVPAVALGVGASYPTGFTGGETLTTTIDGTAVLTTFDVADQSLDQVVVRINAAMALNGIATPIASAYNGQLRFDGIETAYDGTNGTFSFSGTAVSALGLSSPNLTNAQGKDIAINGLFMSQFPSTTDTLTAVKISGEATVDIFAAGQPS